MGTRKPAAVTRVLLAVSDEVDRVVLESDLLRVGFHVSTAETVDDALNAARLSEYDVLVAEIGLAGGGGFSLCRKLTSEDARLPTVGMSVRQIDIEVRRMGAECGMETFVEAPFHRGQLESAVELVIARDRVRNSRTLGLIMSGQLAEWTVPDLIRCMEFYGFTGEIKLQHRDEAGSLDFRDGTLTSAAVGEVFGERGVATMLEWNEGLFTLNSDPKDKPPVPTVRPPRNVHRSAGDLLIDALASRADTERDMADVEGIDEVHDFELGVARHLCRDTQLLGRLRAAFDGRRTLRQVMYSARVERVVETEAVLIMIRGGAIRPHDPARNYILEPIAPSAVIADTMKPRVETPQPVDLSSTIERRGATVIRKLGFKRKSADPQGETFSELENPNDLSQKRTRDRMRLAWISIATIIAVVVLGWLALQGENTRIPEVRMLDDTEEQPEQ